MSKTAQGIPELVAVIQALAEKVERLEKAARMPNIPPATMATALLLTGVTKRVAIAKTIGVSRTTLGESKAFEPFRLAEGAIRSFGAVSRRSRSGGDYIENN